ncbi:MAG: isoamylase early set domain-containing protein [Gemmatimonadota bacterium]|jgi:hypothetical protein
MTGDRQAHDGTDWLDPVVRVLQEPVDRAPGGVDAIVRAAIGSGRAAVVTPGGRWHRLWDWLLRPHLSLSPLSAAGCVAAVALAVVLVLRIPGAAPPAPEPRPVRHQFVLFAPEARTVSLLGDFNGWDPQATPLVERDGVWTALVSLQPGRHVYSFVIDGDQWVADTDAPRAPGDEFGRPSSVVLVTKGG